MEIKQKITSILNRYRNTDDEYPRFRKLTKEEQEESRKLIADAFGCEPEHVDEFTDLDEAVTNRVRGDDI